jgi:hypothetical protein
MTELLSVEFNRTWDDALVKATKTRINNPAISWKSAVEIHALVAKIIVVDAREISPYVMDELEIIRSHDLWFKTIILCYDKRKQDTSYLPGYLVEGKVLLCSDVGKIVYIVLNIANGHFEMPNIKATILAISSSANYPPEPA